jgi:hypothetical protein
MSNIHATILVDIDVSAGNDAINYGITTSTQCPIMSFICVKSSGSGVVKLTPLRATDINIEDSTGSGGRLRISTGGRGNITNVEIAQSGSGYPDGIINVSLSDPCGTGGEILLKALHGKLDEVSIVSPGINYSGYILFDVDDFIEGVNYDIMPKYIEHIGGGNLKLIGYRLSYRPMQVF